MKKEDLSIFKEIGNEEDYTILLRKCNNIISLTKGYEKLYEYSKIECLYDNNFHKIETNISSEIKNILNQHLYNIYRISYNYKNCEECVELIVNSIPDKKLEFTTPVELIRYLNNRLEYEYEYLDYDNDDGYYYPDFNYKVFFDSQFKKLRFLDTKNTTHFKLDKRIEMHVDYDKILILKKEIIKKSTVLNQTLNDIIKKNNILKYKNRLNKDIISFTEIFLNQHLNFIYEKTKDLDMCIFVLKSINEIFPSPEDINFKEVENSLYKKYIFPDYFIRLIKLEFISRIIYKKGRLRDIDSFENMNAENREKFYNKFIEDIFKIINTGGNYSNQKSINSATTYRNGRNF